MYPVFPIFSAHDVSAVYLEGVAVAFSLTFIFRDDEATDLLVQNGPSRLLIDNPEVEPLLGWCTQRISHTCSKIPYD